MGMQLTFSNIFQFLSALSPLLIGFFLVMTSVFNQNIRGIVYLGGVLIACAINLVLMNVVRSPNNPSRSPICDLVELPFGINAFNSPAISSLFIAFTIAYLVLPMHYNDTTNYGVLAALLGLFIMDSISKVSSKCTTTVGVLLGGLVGLVLGGGWFALFKGTGYSSLLFFDEVSSNNVICSRPSKQTFKCSVYKNGELIKHL
tara:strand:- start:457 stop:1062 length:606 start_codon:yes stop_codon:yes gene_type:complete